MQQISDDVPIPASAGKRGRKRKYAIDKLAIGQSLEVAAEDSERLRASAQAFIKKNPSVRFTTRKENGICRIWRIE